MPTPELHFAIGGFLGVVVMLLLSILKNKKYAMYASFLVLLLGVWAMVPDFPEIVKEFDHPNDPILTKEYWNTPMGNVFFAHPWLDQRYTDQLTDKNQNFGFALILLESCFIFVWCYLIIINKHID
jgi:hypothetical protein